MNDAPDLMRWRSEFPILANTTYLISNSLGAMPRGVYDELHQYAETWATRGVRAWNEGWWESPVAVGDEVARVIGAPAGSITMHQNVTLASAVALSCLDFTPRRNRIVMTDMDFPSLLYLHGRMAPPLGEGVEVVMVKSDDGITINLDKLVSAIDERTCLVATSHVLFKSAFVQDAATITRRAHEVGALMALDVFQSAGILPLHVTALGVDFATGGVLKWLCGGPGGAFLYVRPELARTLQPRLTGWMAHAHPFAFEPEMEYADTAFRFLTGTPQVPCLYAAKPGLRIIQQVGVDAIRAKSVQQVAYLIDLARARGYHVTTPEQPARRGGTVAIDLGELSLPVSLELKRRECLVDYRPGAGIRVSPHFYNSDDECERVIREIKDIIRGGAYLAHQGVRPSVT
jgi:kynureninase